MLLQMSLQGEHAGPVKHTVFISFIGPPRDDADQGFCLLLEALRIGCAQAATRWQTGLQAAAKRFPRLCKPSATYQSPFLTRDQDSVGSGEAGDNLFGADAAPVNTYNESR